jgi:hypothetical protein
MDSRAVGPTGKPVKTSSKIKRSVTKCPKHKNSNNTKHPVDTQSNFITGQKCKSSKKERQTERNIK